MEFSLLDILNDNNLYFATERRFCQHAPAGMNYSVAAQYFWVVMASRKGEVELTSQNVKYTLKWKLINNNIKVDWIKND